MTAPTHPNDLTSGSVRSHLTRLSGYLLLGFVANNASYLMDAVYLGILGTEALAAIAFAFPVTFGLNAVARGFATGAASVMARALGARERERAALAASNCFLLVALFCLLCIIVGYAFAADLFRLMGAREEVLALTRSYILIWLLAFPALAITTVGTLMLRAIGSAAVAGFIMTGSALLQIAIAPVLIFGWLGAPELGIDGAAWAVLLSRGLGLMFCLYWYARRERLLVWGPGELAGYWASILHIGIPASANNLIVPLSAGIVTRLLASYGPAVVAGFGVASRLEVFTAMPAMAIASSVGPLVGQNWGAGDFSRVLETMRIAYRFCLAWGFVALVLMLLAAEDLVELI
ncbi:MAG: MATE family efflux transporter, partial [Gammaproteobacteria bacterium]